MGDTNTPLETQAPLSFSVIWWSASRATATSQATGRRPDKPRGLAPQRFGDGGHRVASSKTPT